jgi:hypothetical protein
MTVIAVVRRLVRSRISAFVAGAVVAVVGAGVAVAATSGIPGPDGVIHGCYGVGGALRVVPAGTACLATETALPWSQTGPAGPAGPQGPQGPQGTGNAVYGVGHGAQLSPSVPTATLDGIDITVSGGNHQVLIEEQLGIGAPFTTCSGTVTANITVDGGFFNVASQTATAFPDGNATIPLSAAVVLPAGTHHVAAYVSEGGLGTVNVTGPSVTAVDLGPTDAPANSHVGLPATGGGGAGSQQACPSPTPTPTP